MAANATLSLSFTSSSSTLLSHKQKPQIVAAAKRLVSFSSVPVVFRWKARVCTALASVVAERVERENDGVSDEEEQWKQPRATEVYVCNLPRSCDSEQLLHMFKPHGNVLSVEVFFFLATLLFNLYYLFSLLFQISVIFIVLCCHEFCFLK